MNKGLIISGHDGFIGSNFCKILKKNNIKFVKFYYKKKYKNLLKFTHFYHFDFEIKIKENSLIENRKKLLKILKLCVENQIKLIFPSTCTYLYDKKNKRVSQKIFPLNKYAQSKIQCENEILKYKKKFNLNFLILRIFNVYGTKINNRGVIPSLVLKLKKNKILKLKHSKNIRDFIHINDLLRLLLKTIIVNKNGVFEVGSGKTISIKDLAYKIIKIFKYKSKLIIIKPYMSKKNYFSKSNINKTIKAFSWKPRVKLEEGLKQINN